MHDDAEVQSLHKKPGHSTGPTSRDGKKKSSMNRLSHGLRSEKTILPDEDPAEFAANVQAWLDVYEPQDRKEDELVNEIILAHWQLKRCRKRLEEIEFTLPQAAFDWNDSHHQQYSNFNRYKTTAERSFNRWYKEMETHRGRQFREEQILEKGRLAAAQVELQWLTEQEKKTTGKLVFTQVVEIDVDPNGNCQTYCYPENQEILELYPLDSKSPVVMKRLLIFRKEVPAEYTWANAEKFPGDEELQAWQRMTWSRWLAVIDREEAQGTGHLGPIYSTRR